MFEVCTGHLFFALVCGKTSQTTSHATGKTVGGEGAMTQKATAVIFHLYLVHRATGTETESFSNEVGREVSICLSLPPISMAHY